MTQTIPRRQRLVLVVLVTAASALAAWVTTPRQAAPRGGGGADASLTLALAGDAALSVPLDAGDPELVAIAALIRRASLGVANFELSAPATSLSVEPGAPARWPAATPEAATHLRQLGFGAVSLANNHAFDFGADGLAHVQTQLDAAGIAHAGAGVNLDAARQPAYVATSEGTVALIAVTLSHAAGARATARRGDITGRPGVNALRYTRRLTVPPAAFEALDKAFPPTALVPRGDGRTWDLFGVTVERGDRGGMALVADAEDVDAMVTAVREARRRATAVVVSLHAHEPGNRVDEVPDLLVTVARAAIDAGADVVHGHGPHRLRGIEMRRGRPIFYSLGNLVFFDRGIAPEAADEFEDHALNVLSPFGTDGPPELDFSNEVWWQGAIAIVRLENGRVGRVELHPVDVGVGKRVAMRGSPGPAAPALGAAILERLRVLSAPLGTAVAVENGIGIVTGSPGEATAGAAR